MPSNVYPRGRRFGARLTVSGRERHLGYHATREAAERAVARARGADLPLSFGVSTVGEWADCWQRVYPGRRNETTERHNAQMVAGFVRAYGRLGLAEVSPLVAQTWAVRSPGTVRYLRLMFAKAVKAGLVATNVWDAVEVASGDGSRSPRIPPTPAELGRILDTARARGGWWSHFADLIVFTAYSGLRLEEVADVQAQDRLEAGRVVVRGKRRAGEAGPRVRVAAVFGEGREALARQAPMVGLVWRSQTGRRLNKHSVGRAFGSLAEEAGYSGTFHGLRHYCATWLLDAGASRQDVAVQLGHIDRAGHADTTQVRRVYGHPDVESALARLDGLATLENGSDDEEGSHGGHADAGAAG